LKINKDTDEHQKEKFSISIRNTFVHSASLRECILDTIHYRNTLQLLILSRTLL